MVTTNKNPITDTQRERNTNTKFLKSQNKRARQERNREELQKQPKNSVKIVMSTYLSIIKGKSSKCSNQRYKETEWIKNKSHLYITYKKLT